MPKLLKLLKYTHIRYACAMMITYECVYAFICTKAIPVQPGTT